MCNPLPHCRLACCRRTVQDIPNNFDLLGAFYLMYGACEGCAPPRMLLFVPGGLTIDEYHQAVDDGLVMAQERPDVRAFISPVHLSCTPLKNHRLMPNSLAMIEDMLVNDKAVIGPPRERSDEPASMETCDMPQQDPFKTHLSQVFTIDPSSYRVSKHTKEEN
jgi:hypothetical protein